MVILVSDKIITLEQRKLLETLPSEKTISPPGTRNSKYVQTNQQSFKHMKPNLTELKGEIDKATLGVDSLQPPTLSIRETAWQSAKLQGH